MLHCDAAHIWQGWAVEHIMSFMMTSFNIYYLEARPPHNLIKSIWMILLSWPDQWMASSSSSSLHVHVSTRKTPRVPNISMCVCLFVYTSSHTFGSTFESTLYPKNGLLLLDNKCCFPNSLHITQDTYSSRPTAQPERISLFFLNESSFSWYVLRDLAHLANATHFSHPSG